MDEKFTYFRTNPIPIYPALLSGVRKILGGCKVQIRQGFFAYLKILMEISSNIRRL
jgi:hypothetical protein